MSGRERRMTAGKRMNALIGKAEEEDEAFWNHSTWKEDVDFEGQALQQEEDNSFHESDEDNSDREDVFDSDFDETESENEGGIFDNDAELEAHQEEVKLLKKKKILDMVQADRVSAMKRKKVSAKRPLRMGEGLNAGLILKAPGTMRIQKSSYSNTNIQKITTADPPVLKSDLSKQTPHQENLLQSPLKADTGFYNHDGQHSAIRKRKSSSPRNFMIQSKQSSDPSQMKKIQKQEFTQEDLLLEAIHQTEPENLRWILSRQRVLEDAKILELQKKMLIDEASAANRKIISRFHSKRGCYNTITFPNMDHVPDILVNGASKSCLVHKKHGSMKCVITGKIGRYLDPKTGKRYHDLTAFKELRRRLEAGEPLN